MDKDWKTNLGDFFAINGIYRIKFLNEKLKTYCDEYVNYLNEFYNVKATIRPEYHQREIQRYEISISVHQYSPTNLSPFKLYCVYEETGHLFLKTSVGFDYRAALSGAEEKVDPYKYQEEIFDEPKIDEKEDLFQLFNSRFIEYINRIKD